MSETLEDYSEYNEYCKEEEIKSLKYLNQRTHSDRYAGITFTKD